MGRACSMHEIQEECIQGFGGKREEKRPLGRPRRSWKDDIKIEIREK
jgi:hypothetical protein